MSLALANLKDNHKEKNEREKPFLFVADSAGVISALERIGFLVGTSGRCNFSDSWGSVVGTSGISSTASYKQNIHHHESLSISLY